MEENKLNRIQRLDDQLMAGKQIDDGDARWLLLELRNARVLIRSVYYDYSHPMFTDRHGTADILKEFLGD